MTDQTPAEPDGEGEEPLKERVEAWLTRQMPIIQMHGGTSAVRTADPETGEVVVELGGTCAGCGISDVTVQNIEGQLYQDFPELTDITVRTPGGADEMWGDEYAIGFDRSEGGRG